MDIRKCTKCKKILHVYMFCKCSQNKSGLYSHCKKCQAVAHAKYLKTAKGKIVVDRIIRKHYLKNHYKFLERTMAWKIKNLEKVKAHRAVRVAVRNGKLIKQPCLCGKAKVVAHHPRYDKPLSVIWLCYHHHSKLHAELSAA